MITAGDIATFLGVELDASKAAREIVDVKSIDDPNFGSNSLGWCSEKNSQILDGKKGIVLISAATATTVNSPETCFIAVDTPRRAFAEVLRTFFVPKKTYGEIANSATIHASVKYDPAQVLIGANVVIEQGCVLDHFVEIGANTVIKSGTIIDSHVTIGSNCTIGGVGFGYEPDESGTYELLPHIGCVHLSQGVEIGNNVCIDRAVLGETWLGSNVKVDNLVHIAHGVHIDENSLIIANAMIAGSVKIGKNVWVAPNASIRQKLTIGDNAIIGLGSVVVKNVEANTTVAGVPAKPIPSK